MLEIAAVSVALILFLGMTVSATGIDGEELRELSAAAGKVVLAHIGWAFGVFVPILLGFFAIVIGGQLAETSNAGATQRKLGLVAEVMVGSLAPALLLATIACIAEPALAGALFVIVPVAMATLFLAVQLGGFVVFEAALVIAAAERAQASLNEVARSLRVRSHKSGWLVYVVNLISGLGLCVGGMVLFSSADFHDAALLLLLGILVAFHVGACFFSVWVYKFASDRTNKIMGWFLGVVVTVTMIILITPTVTYFGWPAGWSLFGAITFTVISSLWPIANAPRFVVDWSIQGAATRYAARTVAKSYAKAVRDILKARAELSSTKPSLWNRLKGAAYGLRTGSPTASL